MSSTVIKQFSSALPSGRREAVKMLKLRKISPEGAAIAGGTSGGAMKSSTHYSMITLRKVLSKE